MTDDLSFLRRIRQHSGETPAPIRDRGEPDAEEDEVASADIGKAVLSPGHQLCRPLVPGAPGVQADYQARTAHALAGIVSVSGQGPLASSIAQHCGRAAVQVMDQAHASNVTLGPQLGRRDPGGNPHLRAGQQQRPGTMPQRPAGSPAYNAESDLRGLQGTPAPHGSNLPPGFPAVNARRRAPGE